MPGQENLINYESLYNEGSTLINKFKYIIDKQRERIIQLESQLNERNSTTCTLRPYSSESVKLVLHFTYQLHSNLDPRNFFLIS